MVVPGRGRCRIRRSAAIPARSCSRATARTAATAGRRSRPTTARSDRGSAWPTASASAPSCARRTASTIPAAAPSAAAPARATAPARSASRPTRASRARTASIPSYNWNNGVPSYPAPPFFDPTLNAGFVAGRGTGGGVTYGDPEIGGRPPRYQNWNAGFQYALARTLTRRRDLRRKPRRFPRRQRARVLLESARSALPRRSATC